MSVFDGEIEFRSVYMVDFAKKEKPKSPRRKAVDDDCLIVGLSRDSLKPKDAPRRCPDVLCPIKHEYYKDAVKRFEEDHPKLTKMYMSKDVDPKPIENEIQDLKRTEYLTKYCSRELPFMSVNLARRARALQTLRLPDDIEIPDTSHKGSYRMPKPEKYAEPPSSLSMRPKYDFSLTGNGVSNGAVMRSLSQCRSQKWAELVNSRSTVYRETDQKLRRIQRIRTGDTAYQACHSLLARVILDENPFGPPREEPAYGRWLNPYTYTYRI